MNLTKEQAIEEHRKKWRWIARETRRRKRFVYQGEYIKRMFPKENIANYDFCCEYAEIEMFGNCKNCPVDWGCEGDKEMCKGKGGSGLFNQWVESKDWQQAADIAERIAELPERKIRKRRKEKTE